MGAFWTPLVLFSLLTDCCDEPNNREDLRVIGALRRDGPFAKFESVFETLSYPDQC